MRTATFRLRAGSRRRPGRLQTVQAAHVGRPVGPDRSRSIVWMIIGSKAHPTQERLTI